MTECDERCLAAMAEYVCWEHLARTIPSHRDEGSDFKSQEELIRSQIKQTLGEEPYGGSYGSGLCWKLGFSAAGQ